MPWLGRCWNRPTESRSPPGRFRRVNSWMAVATAMIHPRRGIRRCCPTVTIVAALATCSVLQPSTVGSVPVAVLVCGGPRLAGQQHLVALRGWPAVCRCHGRRHGDRLHGQRQKPKILQAIDRFRNSRGRGGDGSGHHRRTCLRAEPPPRPLRPRCRRPAGDAARRRVHRTSPQPSVADLSIGPAVSCERRMQQRQGEHAEAVAAHAVEGVAHWGHPDDILLQDVVLGLVHWNEPSRCAAGPQHVEGAR